MIRFAEIVSDAGKAQSAYSIIWELDCPENIQMLTKAAWELELKDQWCNYCKHAAVSKGLFLEVLLMQVYRELYWDVI